MVGVDAERAFRADDFDRESVEKFVGEDDYRRLRVCGFNRRKILSPLRGLVSIVTVPTACAVGCILSQLRG